MRWLIRFAASTAIAGLFVLGVAANEAPATPPPPVEAKEVPPSPPWKERIYFGGGIGMAFGEVNYISIWPQIGYSFNPKWSAGLALSYTYRNDSRYSPELSTNDYGYDLFSRYRLIPQAFAELRYSHTSFEVPLTLGGTERDSYSGYLLGGGFVQPMGGRSSFIVSALYDFNYSDNSPTPYDSPWVVTVGVNVGF